MKRSDRENTALAKSEQELERALEVCQDSPYNPSRTDLSLQEYQAADNNLRSTLPPLIMTTFSLLPHLLAAQIQTQNTLLAHYYTMLHSYCADEGFPSPPPPMDEVVRVWSDTYCPVQRDAESINILATGKAVRMPMKLEDQKNGAANGYPRRPSGPSSLRKPSVSPARNLPPSPALDPLPRIASTPSPSASTMLSPPVATPDSTIASPTPSDYHTPMAFSPAAPRMDYFSRDRQPSAASISSTYSNLSTTIAAKKKPPPPPPRLPSSQGTWVTALYDFGGQGHGDLVFKEGDRIKVTKKTDSTDDWWEGELRGVKGSFPANYCG